MASFEVGDKVTYNPDPRDPLAFSTVPGRYATVIAVEPMEGKYPITIQFMFSKKQWPVKADEITKVED